MRPHIRHYAAGMITHIPHIPLLLCAALAVTAAPLVSAEIGANSASDRAPHAHQNPLEITPPQPEQAKNTISITSTDADTCAEQDGIGHLVDLTVPAPNSVAKVEQSGSDNRLTAELTGADQQLFVHQTDSGNTVDLTIGGSGNQLLIAQTGTGNLIDSLLIGCDNIQLIQQFGSNNEVHIQQRGMTNGFNLLQ